MDEDLLRENCRSFKQSIDRYYGGKGLVLAAVLKQIYKIFISVGNSNISEINYANNDGL